LIFVILDSIKKRNIGTRNIYVFVILIKYLFICYLLNAFGIDHKQRPIGFLFMMEKLSKIIVKIREMEQWSLELIT